MKTEWAKHKRRILNGSMDEDKASYLFGFDFGLNVKVYTLTNMELVFEKLPPSRIRSVALVFGRVLSLAVR